ncbi:MAG: ATP synthase subunit C [Synergistaceae bacterium]|jgi:V/A-type H+-transporting ATPase subunit K|nr:ATP synthase subunit C [Synergistaceae bacterium]
MLGLVILAGTVAALVGTGYWMMKNGRVVRDPKRALGLAMFCSFMMLGLSAAATVALAAETPEAAAASAGSAAGLGFIGAALSTGLACLGAGIGVAFVGSAALGVVGEKPSFFGTTLIYVGLAEGIAIYGLVISLFILGRIPG